MKAIKSAIEKGYEPEFFYWHSDAKETIKVWTPTVTTTEEIGEDVAEYLELCLIQRWLREKGISVDINTGWLKGKFCYEVWVWKGSDDGLIAETFYTYEQALEAGIEKAVELI